MLPWYRQAKETKCGGNHYLDLDWLREAFYRTRQDGAPGVDGQTWAGYAENLEENLQSLLDRAKSGTYWAPPVRRVYIAKGTADIPGRGREVGVASCLQNARWASVTLPGGRPPLALFAKAHG